MARRSKQRLVSMSLEEVARQREGKLEVKGLGSAAGQIARLVGKGFRVIAVVGGGSLGEEYARVASKFSKGKHAEVRSRAAEANSLLLVAALRGLKVAVNAAPLTDFRRVEEFLSNPNWSVAVVANPDERRSSLVASRLAKKYRAALIHFANTRKAIDRAI